VHIYTNAVNIKIGLKYMIFKGLHCFQLEAVSLVLGLRGFVKRVGNYSKPPNTRTTTKHKTPIGISITTQQIGLLCSYSKQKGKNFGFIGFRKVGHGFREMVFLWRCGLCIVYITQNFHISQSS
jgi:hypothetical protein